jgi:hypothetical protein
VGPADRAYQEDNSMGKSINIKGKRSYISSTLVQVKTDEITEYRLESLV